MSTVNVVASGSAESHSQAGFFSNLFEQLERVNIRYCVLHCYAGLPQSHESDLDLALHPLDIPKLAVVFDSLRGSGYRPLQCLNYAAGAVYYVFGWFETTGFRTAAVDIIHEHRRGARILASGEELVAGRRQQGEYWIPAPAVEFEYLLCKKVLKESLPQVHEEQLRYLASSLPREESERIISGLFGAGYAKSVLDDCLERRLGASLPRLRQRMTLRALTHPIEWTRYWTAECIRMVRRAWNPTGMLIAVLGPDGVGKTTLIENLNPLIRPLFRRSAILHWRPAVIGRRPADPENIEQPHAQPPRSTLGSLGHLMFYLLDYWLGYVVVLRPLLTRSALVWFDRYLDDVLVDPRRYRSNLKAGWVTWLVQCRPTPDLVIILDAPDGVISLRKSEVTAEEVSRQRLAYRDLLALFPAAVIVDAGPSRDCVVHNAVREIADYLDGQFANRHGRDLGFSILHRRKTGQTGGAE